MITIEDINKVIEKIKNEHTKESKEVKEAKKELT